MNLERLTAFNARLGGQVSHLLKGLDKLRPAVRVARVVQRVYANENVARAQHLSPSQRKRQENRIARRYIRNGNAVRHIVCRAALGHVDVAGERGAAKDAQIDSRSE